MTMSFFHFKHLEKCISEKKKKNSFECLVKYVLYYHKYKIEYVELKAMKIVLISVIIEKEINKYCIEKLHESIILRHFFSYK